MEEPVDLIGLSGVPVKGKLKNPREKVALVVGVTGVDINKIADSLPTQSVDRDNKQISIQKVDLSSIGESSIAQEGTEYADALVGTLISRQSIPISEQRVLKSSPLTNRLEAIQAINQFVFDYMEKTPVIGVPNGLTALQQAQGDCNEHTALFVSLASAANIPARIAAGIVFSDRTGPLKQFYYHAPEVLVQQDGQPIWIPVDPTFGQVPADATHIKLVEGGLDRQVEIMAHLGQIKLEMISDTPSSMPKKKMDAKPEAQTTPEPKQETPDDSN